MNCSTSWVERLRLVVITCTWLLVMSGTAPMGICVREYNPKPAMVAVNSSTISLFLMLNPIIYSSIGVVYYDGY